MGFIARFQNADKNESDIELALREALANAIVHGNREDPQKRVFVICRCWTNGAVLVTVRDEGQGVEIETVPIRQLRRTGCAPLVAGSTLYKHSWTRFALSGAELLCICARMPALC